MIAPSVGPSALIQSRHATEQPCVLFRPPPLREESFRERKRFTECLAVARSAASSCPNIPRHTGEPIDLGFAAEHLNSHEADLRKKNRLALFIDRPREIKRRSSGRTAVDRANLVHGCSCEILLRNVRRYWNMKIPCAIRRKQIVHRGRKIRIEEIKINSITTHQYSRHTGVLREN